MSIAHTSCYVKEINAELFVLCMSETNFLIIGLPSLETALRRNIYLSNQGASWVPEFVSFDKRGRKPNELHVSLDSRQKLVPGKSANVLKGLGARERSSKESKPLLRRLESGANHITNVWRVHSESVKIATKSRVIGQTTCARVLCEIQIKVGKVVEHTR